MDVRHLFVCAVWRLSSVSVSQLSVFIKFIAPAEFWPKPEGGHPWIPRVYTYKDKEDLLKK